MKNLFLISIVSLLSMGALARPPEPSKESKKQSLLERRQDQARENQGKKWQASEMFRKKEKGRHNVAPEKKAR